MKNQPYNVLRHNNHWERAPREPFSTIAWIATTFSISTFWAGVAFYVGTTLITSWAMRALTPKPDFSALTSQGILVNSREPNAAQQIVYGEMRKGGSITYIEATGDDNKYLHLIITLAGHPVNQIGDIYIDDEIVTWDQATGNVTDAFLDGDGNPCIRIEKYDGTQTSAPANLVSEGSVSSNFVGRDMAYLYVRLTYNQDAFPNGIPLFTAVVQGKKVYDPRTLTTAYSDNAALCIRDYLTSEYGLDDDKIDDTAFAAAANISDEQVPKATSGTAPRYTINGVVTMDTSHGEVLNRMVTACAGSLFWGTGKWKLNVADYITPTKTLTLDDLRSSISVQTRNNLRDQFNIVQGTFINKEERWITSDYPPVVGSAFITEDGGVEQYLDLELPFTTDPAIAQRLAKLTLFRAREQVMFSADFGMNAFDVEVGEIIQLDLDRYGWSNKEFEVIGWQLKPNAETGDLRVNLTLRETSAAAFAWNAEEEDIIDNDTNLPSPFDVQLPSLDAAQVDRVINADGTTIIEILFTWSVTEPSKVDHYEFQYKLSTEPTSAYKSVVVDSPAYLLSPALSETAYDYRVRSVNVLGVKSAFVSSATPVSSGKDGTVPKAPTGLNAEAGPESIKLNWTAPTQNTDNSTLNDLFLYKVYRHTSNSFGSATLVGRVAADVFTDTVLVGGEEYYYWVTAVDYTGNESAPSSPDFATAGTIETQRPNGVFYIGVGTLPTTSSGANLLFTNAIGDPIERDQAWFYTGTLANPTAQSVWIYNGTSWNEQEEVIDGDLLVSGTVTADKLIANNIAALGLTIGSLSSSPTGARTEISDDKIWVYDANGTLRVKIGNLT